MVNWSWTYCLLHLGYLAFYRQTRIWCISNSPALSE